MASDRSLRRLVIRLARLRADDRTAVLDELEPDQRATVERLLGGYLGLAAGTPSVPHSPVSLWLVGRFREEGRMTDEARETLRHCAAELFPVPPTAGPSPSASLLGRLTSWALPR
ncbi:hypothetical protein [Flavisphingomonas formosensis]|uniref:hypothetical protein n=1 Tax=Flavisphingomonas formosensis TaxID=861534 RepID=UPI0012F73800|nr:hypothetical protein [Sphingomonas formosensis]